MGTVDLIHCILTLKAISEVTQYYFNLQTMTTLPKHFLLPEYEQDRNDILVLDCIKKTFKLVNISPVTKFREIWSVSSGQARSKARRSALKSTPNFSKDDQVIHEEESNAFSSYA